MCVVMSCVFIYDCVCYICADVYAGMCVYAMCMQWCVYVCALCVSMCICMDMGACHVCQNWMSDPFDLELQVMKLQDLGSRNRALVLWKNSKCSSVSLTRKVRVTHTLSLSRWAPSLLKPIHSLNGLYPQAAFGVVVTPPSIFAYLSQTSLSTISTNRSHIPQGSWSSSLPLTPASLFLPWYTPLTVLHHSHRTPVPQPTSYSHEKNRLPWASVHIPE